MHCGEPWAHCSLVLAVVLLVLVLVLWAAAGAAFRLLLLLLVFWLNCCSPGSVGALVVLSMMLVILI